MRTKRSGDICASAMTRFTSIAPVGFDEAVVGELFGRLIDRLERDFACRCEVMHTAGRPD